MITKYEISAITPGMKLGKPVITEDGKIVLTEYTILTEWMIVRLKEWGCLSVDILQEYTQQSILGTEQKYFIEEHAKIVHAIEDAFNKTRHFKEVPIKEINDIADSTIKRLLNANSVISYLHLINNTDDYTFRHSLNVSVICGVIGKWLRFSKEQIRNLVLAGLLHDIGKTRIPIEILNKPAKLTSDEMNFMKQHSMFGYELISGAQEINTIVKMGILQHHERLDGTGYPQNLFKHDILLEAKILAVADTYDAMTSNRMYRSALTPFFVMEELLQEMFGKLDAEICMLFINHMKDELLGVKVLLSNGAEGKIIFIDKEYSIKPIVQIADGTCIELSGEKDIVISSFLSDIT